MNRVRIIGGEWRSRLLRFPTIDGLRPTPGRVRETVFNWLGQDLSGQRCLDVYAGSGALGFEAASRGASRVLLVESDRSATTALIENKRTLEAAVVEVVRADALEFLRAHKEEYDVVFLDPPYAMLEADPALRSTLLARVAPRLAAGGKVYLEGSAPAQLPEGWQTVKCGRAGAVHYQLAEAITR